MVFCHVYDEEKCYILPCLWRGKHIDAMSMARVKRKDVMSMARKDAMSMVYECLCFEQGVEPLLSYVPISHSACGRGHGVDELLVFAGLRDQWCKECPQEMITTLEGRKSLEGL